MATAQQTVAIAKGEIGYTESPAGSNKTKFGAWYPANGQPWCAMFVSWCLDQAGITKFKHAYTPYGVDLFKKADRWHAGTSGVKAGDVVYFDFPDSTYRVQHVGFAIGPEKDGYVPTVEGNTSAGSSGSQDNGGGVFQRSRPKSHIVGYGRPAYSIDYDYKVTATKGERTRKRRFERIRGAMTFTREKIKHGWLVRVRRVR